MLKEVKVSAWLCSICNHISRSKSKPSRCTACGKSASDTQRGRPKAKQITS